MDLLENKAYTYTDGKPTEVPVPDTNGYIDELMNDINEAVAEVDDDLMEKFFAEEPFTHDELISGIKKGTKAGTLYPVIAGDSITREGIDLALKYFSALMPAPSDEEVNLEKRLLKNLIKKNLSLIERA